MVVATVVPALAALGALWFARDTVRDTRELRREDRIAHLPERVAELGQSAPNEGRTMTAVTDLANFTAAVLAVTPRS